jgi:hypothetical protein
MIWQTRSEAELLSHRHPNAAILPAATRVRLFPLSVLCGIAVATLIGRLWSPVQSYSDIIVGAITFANVGKTKDYFGLVLILLLASTSYYLALRLAASAVRRSGGAEWLNALLNIPLILLAYWAGVQLISFDASPPYESLITIVFLLMFLPVLLHSGQVSARLLMDGGMLGLVDLLLLGFGGLGIGFTLARVLHLAPSRIMEFAGAYTLMGAGGVIAAAWRSARLEDGIRKIVTLTYWFQAPLPLLFFAVLPRDRLYQGQRISAQSAYLLTGVLWAACFVAWISLYRRYCRRTLSGTARLRTHLEPLCLLAIATCLASRAVFPGILGDDFHFGEQFLPWQQLVQFGRLPYIDLIPIHGTMPLITGALNSLFFHGTVGSFESATLLLTSAASGLTFLSLYVIGGLGPALLYLLCLNQMDRFYLFGPVLLFISRPRRFRSWQALILSISLVVFAVSYNIPAGTALLVGFGPILTVEAYRFWKAGYGRRRSLLFTAGALLLVVAGAPLVRNTVRGAILFTMEAGQTNTIAHGTMWEGISAVAPPNLNSLVSPLLFEVMKFGWIPMVLVAMAALISMGAEGLPKLWRAENRLLVCFVLSAMAMAPWSVNRIDPGFSRTGSFTAYCVAVVLPLLVLRFGKANRHGRQLVLPVTAIVLGMFAAQNSTVAGFSQISARLSPIVPVPADLTCVEGASQGMPNLGEVCLPPARLDALTRFDRSVSHLVGDSGTYFDLTNRQALYAFTRRKEPALYATPYIAVSHQQQEHVLQQLRTNPVNVVFASPAMNFDGLPTGLRSYLLFRYVTRSFRPCKIAENLFLVNSSVDRSLCENVAEQPLWDAQFAHWNLEGLPSAWGASWSSLKGLFAPTSIGLGPSRLEGLLRDEKQQFTVAARDFDEQTYLNRYPDVASAVRSGTLVSGYQHYNLYGKAEGRSGRASANLIVDLQSLNVDPRYYDFLTIQLTPDTGAPKRLPIELRWVSDLGEVTQPVQFFLEGNRAVVPVGSYPQWLLARRIESLRIGFASPVNFRIGEFQLLHYRPSDSVR